MPASSDSPLNLFYAAEDDDGNDDTVYSGFRLLELPPDLLKLVEAAQKGDRDALPPGYLTIRGGTADDAVICTPDKTYAMRSTTLSNTMAIVTAPSADRDNLMNVDGEENDYAEADLVIRDQLHEYLQLMPILPRMERLEGLLRGNAVGLLGDEEEEEGDVGASRKKRRITHEEAKQVLQASDAEFLVGLRKARAVTVDGHLKQLSIEEHSQMLTNILNVIVSEELDVHDISVEQITQQMSETHSLPAEITEQVLSWYGRLRGDQWSPRFSEIVAAIGEGLLSQYRENTVPQSQFLTEWKAAVGDTFEDEVDLTKLNVRTRPFSQDCFVSSANEQNRSSVSGPVLRYFPASELPSDPSARFADLFATRQSWSVEAIAPFLAGIAVDSKERDKLLLKFCRAIKGSDGQTWYTSRAKA